MNREIGTIEEFSNGTYQIVENNIVPERHKKGFLIKLNIYTLVLSVIGIFIILLLNPGTHKTNIFLLFGLILGFLAYVIIHELLHGLAFMIFNKTKWKDIAFGVVLKSGMAYCISKVPVKVNAARLSLMMPVYLFCIPMMIVGILLDNVSIQLFAWVYFTGSTGDIYYMWKLRKTTKEYYMYEEMPSKSGYEIGYLLYEKMN